MAVKKSPMSALGGEGRGPYPRPMDRRGRIGLAVAAGVLVAVVLLAVARGRTSVVGDAIALIGEARTGGLTLNLPEPVADVRVREARLPGRPIVLIDPG